MSGTSAIRILFWWSIFWLCYWTWAYDEVNAGPAAGKDIGTVATPSSVPDQSAERDSLVSYWTWAYDIPPEIAIAVSHAENHGGDSMAVSTAGAIGLMQVLPRAHARLIKQICGYDVSIFERECNVRVGLHILSMYYRRHGYWPTALRAYNGSLRHEAQGRAYVQAVGAHMHQGGTLR